MANDQQQNTSDADEQQAASQQLNQDASDSGMPGGGVGRKEGPFNTPVYPVSADSGASGDATVETENAWGQGQRGAAGYQNSGDSSLDDAGQMERQDEQLGTQQGNQQPSQQ